MWAVNQFAVIVKAVQCTLYSLQLTPSRANNRSKLPLFQFNINILGVFIDLYIETALQVEQFFAVVYLNFFISFGKVLNSVLFHSLLGFICCMHVGKLNQNNNKM